MGKRTVKLTYFKKTGKYYTDAEYETDATFTMLDIWKEVGDMRLDGKLPGMSSTDAEFGHTEFVVLVEVPEILHNPPKLIGMR
jgi:hypothetical protein